jgi:hypothetical protein
MLPDDSAVRPFRLHEDRGKRDLAVSGGENAQEAVLRGPSLDQLDALFGRLPRSERPIREVEIRDQIQEVDIRRGDDAGFADVV